MDHERYIVEQIKEAREVRGMPIAELARRSLIDSTQLGKVLRYERSLKPGECLRICYASDLSASSVLIPKETHEQLQAVGKKPKGEPGKKKLSGSRERDGEMDDAPGGDSERARPPGRRGRARDHRRALRSLPSRSSSAIGRATGSTRSRTATITASMRCAMPAWTML